MKTYKAKEVIAVLGLTRTTYDAWRRRGILTPSINADRGSGTQVEFTKEDILLAKIVTILRGVRIDLSKAVEIAELARSLLNIRFWYDIETGDCDCGEVPTDRRAIIVMDTTKILKDLEADLG